MGKAAQFHRGEDIVLPVTATMSDGEPTNISDMTISVEVWSLSRAFPEITDMLSVEVTDAASGEFDLTIPDEATTAMRLGRVTYLKIRFDHDGDTRIAGPLYLEGILP